jgi:predicted nucleotidyltransferase
MPAINDVMGAPPMKDEIIEYLARVAEFFKSRLESRLVDVYKMGSLAHGGFSQTFSDLDVGVILDCPNPPEGMDGLISGAKELDAVNGKRLSVFWGNPECDWGRLPVLDRLDLLDHGVPLLHNHKVNFERPGREAIHRALLESVEKSWKPRTEELFRSPRLEPKDRKGYIRCLLYPARLIYTWDRLEIDSNDRAVAFLGEVKPAGLDLHPIEAALACRYDRTTPEEIFSQKIDLCRQFEATIAYISKHALLPDDVTTS